MLRFKNDYDDRVVTIVSREVRTGRDGPATELQPGDVGSIEVDGEFQVIASTRGRLPGEDPILHPVAAIAAAQRATVAELAEAPDDIVRGEIAHMIDNKIELTNAGPPNLEALNARLADAGFGPINAKKRGELMPATADV